MKNWVKLGCAWSLGIIALAWIAVALLQSHFGTMREERAKSLARDDTMDRSFDARAPAALEARIMLSTAQGGYQEEADRPSLQHRIAALGKLPVIVVLPGCGFPVWGKDVPRNVAILSVDEDPHLLDRPSSSDACVAQSEPALRDAIDQDLAFLMAYVARAAWIDRSRVMIAGYGEAAPAVAAYAGPVRLRLTLGDPCLVPWRSVRIDTPLTLLLTADRQGLSSGSTPRRPPDIAAIAKGATPILAGVKACIGLRRPDIRAPVRSVVAAGRLGMFERPAALSQAHKAAYTALIAR